MSSSHKKGKFIVIEGIRGSGKTTIMNYLKEVFSGADIVFTREPGGSVLAEKIREVMLCEEARQALPETHFGLIWASRTDHLKNTIRPALDAGKIVITDRFDTSTYGLQVFAQESYYLKDLFFMVRELFVGKTVPDMYIFLDVDPAIGTERFNKRTENKTHFHDREPIYYERIRNGYHDFMTRVPHRIVDANQGVEGVKKDVLAIMRELIG